MFQSLIATTPRLKLRPVTEEDAEPTAGLVTVDVSENLLSWHYPTSTEQVIERVRKAHDAIEQHQAVNWAILRREDQRLLGWIVIGRVRGGLGSIGYWLGRQYRGHGYMREAASHAIPIGSAYLSLETIRADVFPENKASIAVIEALGFRRCGKRRVMSVRTGRHERVCRYRRDAATELART
jgi:[ribosomal protein S5]-alanine N-acetyltransferase